MHQVRKHQFGKYTKQAPWHDKIISLFVLKLERYSGTSLRWRFFIFVGNVTTNEGESGETYTGEVNPHTTQTLHFTPQFH